MKHDEIIKLLNEGKKIISVRYGLTIIHYYIDEMNIKRKLTEQQFFKYKKLCNKKIEPKIINDIDDIYQVCYYWIE